MTVLTTHEQQQIDRANAEGKQPVVFVHGLWLLASSWDPWRALFEEQGYTTLTPGWPDDPETVAQATDDPEVFAHKRIKQVTDHYADAIRQLKRKPAVIGHSFGGLIAQQLADEGLSAVTVAIDAAGFRGVLPLPLSELKSGAPVLSNPANYHRAVALTYEQFRYGFANALEEDEATSSTTGTRSPGQVRSCSRALPPTSTPGRKTGLTRRTPRVAPSCSSRASKTIRSSWRSSRLSTSCSNTILLSRSFTKCLIADTPSPLTMDGVRWLRLRSPSSRSS
jgi:non-heme chloroperoxidase